MNGRLAGLDVGDKRIGVAVADALGITAQPLGLVERHSHKADIAGVLSLLADYEVGCFVAGLPLQLDGAEGEQADRTRHFCGHLERETGLPVVFQDERFSTAESERLLIDSGMRRGKRKLKRDQLAAAIILQGYLDGGGAGRAR